MNSAILYIRVSTDEQAEKGYSQRHQKEVLLKYCQQNNIAVNRVIFEDYSAKTFKRPGWKEISSDFKLNPDTRPNLILFTKWDRFSRNTADAYLMIRSLNEFGILAQAIEQPLNLDVPENKMMLAFYLAAPEIENHRRSLNTFFGMRKASKEGRYLTTAPKGYMNKVDEAGKKSITPVEPDASLIRWAFEQIGTGLYPTDMIRKELNKKGMECSKSNFYRLIKNPVYSGKIRIREYKNEQEYLVTGQHIPIISERLFQQVQKKLNIQQTSTRVNPAHNNELILRRFLICPRCSKVLTGSRSKGRSAHYYYYHCQSPCKQRYQANIVHEFFLKELAKWKPKPEFLTLFKLVLKEKHQLKMHSYINERNNLINKLQTELGRFNNARTLLLDGGLSIEEYNEIKLVYKVKTEDLQHTLDKTPDHIDLFWKSIQEQERALLNLNYFFTRADICSKTALIHAVFPSNLIFDETGFQTPAIGRAIHTIYI